MCSLCIDDAHSAVASILGKNQEVCIYTYSPSRQCQDKNSSLLVAEVLEHCCIGRAAQACHSPPSTFIQQFIYDRSRTREGSNGEELSCLASFQLLFLVHTFLFGINLHIFSFFSFFFLQRIERFKLLSCVKVPTINFKIDLIKLNKTYKNKKVSK